MPYQVQQIIEGKGMPVCVTRDDTVSAALSLMIEHDFSQLPVIKKVTEPMNRDIPEGMITHEGILRGVRNFKAKIEDLKVRDVMIAAPIYSIDDDLFDILDRLKDTNAVLISEDIGLGVDLVGIVTSYDTTDYFRMRTEDLMRVEDIELMVKEFIKMAYANIDGEIDNDKLANAVAQVTAYRKTSEQSEKELSFEELSLADYTSLLLHAKTWAFVDPIFGVQRSFISELLNGVRKIRNELAHFRGDITAEQRDRLKFGAEWFSRRQEEYQKLKERKEFEELVDLAKQHQKQASAKSELPTESALKTGLDSINPSALSITESTVGGGRYAALADWLQGQPGGSDPIQLTFNQIEEIIGGDLPESARSYRAWWANDSVGHSHSQLWLEAGWRTTYINLSEGRITFSRIREREKAYIAFFSRLLDELRKKADFPIREASPDGASWIYIQTIPRHAGTFGFFMFSFSRDKRLRVELYLDLFDKAQTKAVFDLLLAQREQLEAQLGPIEWERLESKRASRIASYHEGHIAEEKGHAELRKWAAETMVKFYNALAEPAEKAILEVKKI